MNLRTEREEALESRKGFSNLNLLLSPGGLPLFSDLETRSGTAAEFATARNPHPYTP